jgi:hypothetical protein
MARRRVFHVKVECTGIKTDLAVTANKFALFGRPVILEKTESGSIALRFDGAIVGHLDDVLGTQVIAALDRGQAFTAKIENAYQNYDARLKPTSQRLDLKVEYLLEKDQPAIEIPKPVYTYKPHSFFTKVAGITFDGRQRIAAQCYEGERLFLIREPNNPKDRGAIKIVRRNGDQLGYVPRDVARYGDPTGLSFRMDRGDDYQCRIKDRTGGTSGMSHGINIEIGTDLGFDELHLAPSPESRAYERRTYEEPPHSNYVWLVFTGVAVIVFVIVLILRN